MLFDVFSLGISIAIACNYFFWNSFAQVGFTTLTLTYFIFGTAYIALVCSIGEVLCALPFNGGAFGVVRCTIGLFPGFLAGFGETAYYITLGSLQVDFLTDFLSEVLSIEPKFAPALWIVFYAIGCTINIQHKSPVFFWRFTNAMCILCLFLVLIYCLGSISSLQRSTSDKGESISNYSFSFFQYLPQSAWFFIGIESLPLACNTSSLTRESIAIGSLICIVTLFFTNFAILCITFFLFENSVALTSELFPLNEGYISFLGCTSTQASLLAFPSLLASIIGFTFSHGKMICALSESRLLPNLFAKKTAANCPYAALLAGCFIGYCICWTLHFFPEAMSSALLQFMYLTAFTIYGLYCIGYIVLKTRYLKSIEYTYQSPLGLFGAGYVILVFLLGICSLLFLQGHFPWGLVILAGLCLMASAYYFAVAKAGQRFSEEEQRCVSLASKPKTKIKVKNNKKLRVLPATDQPECGIHPNSQFDMQLSSSEKKLEFKHAVSGENIRKVLMDKEQAAELKARAERLFCTESVDFCEQAILYKQATEEILAAGTLFANVGKIHADFLQIVQKFILADSPYEINISGKQKADIVKLQDFKVYSGLHPLRMLAIFDETVAEVEMMLRDNNMYSTCEHVHIV